MELRKKYVLRHDDLDTTATVVRDGAGRVWVETDDGEKLEDAVVLDHGRTVSIRRRGRMYLVDLTPPRVKELRAMVNGHGGAVELLDELAAAAATGEGRGPSERELRADMPGLVVEIKCSLGEAVRRGQALVVLEAMKMQNELCSPADGVVEDIRVEPGRSVETGAVLIRLAEPDPPGPIGA